MKSLTPERWRQIDEIFAAALEVAPEQWPALLDERCGQDSALRREVEKLLASVEEAEGVIGESVTHFAEPVMVEPVMLRLRGTTVTFRSGKAVRNMLLICL